MVRVFRNVVLAVGAGTVVSAGASAGTIAYEGFDYAVATPLSAAVAPAAFTGWKSDNASLPGYGMASGLSYGALATSGNSATGGYAYTVSGMNMKFSNPGWDSTETSVWAPYTKVATNQYTGSDKMIGKDGTTVYVSWLMQNVSVPGWAGATCLGLNVDAYNAADPMALNTVGLGVSVSPAGAVQLQTTSYTGTYDVAPRPTQTSAATGGTAGLNFFVLRIDFGAANDTVSLYVNPSLASEPALPNATITTTGDLVFRSVNVYGGTGAGESKWDEIRFGSDWAGAVPVPEPTAMGLLTIGGAMLLRRRRRAAR